MSYEAFTPSQLLPHGTPVILMDRILTLTPRESVSTSLYLDPSLDIFQNHFPDYPVYPGSLLTEAMAQTAGVMLVSLPEYRGWLPLLSGIRNMRFLRPANPGDTLIFTAQLLTEAGNNLFDCRVSVHLSGAQEEKRLAQGELTLALRQHG